MVVGPGKKAENVSPVGFHIHTGLRSINLAGEAGREAGGGNDTVEAGAGGQEGHSIPPDQCQDMWLDVPGCI